MTGQMYRDIQETARYCTHHLGENMAANRIVDSSTEKGKKYPIEPVHIHSEAPLWDAFGNMETEVSARFIVRLCQAKGGWFPFTKEEIDVQSREDYRFNRLIEFGSRDERNLVILGDDNQYRVTHEFIARCFRSSPSF